MGVYIFLCIFPFLAFIFSKVKYPVSEKKYRSTFLVVTYCVLLFISGFRNNTVGGDLERYLPEFRDVATTPFFNIVKEGYGSREYGYAVLERIIGIIGSQDVVFIFLTSFVFITIFWGVISKYSQNVFFSVLLFILFFLGNSFNIIRASIAVAICISSYESIVNRKIKRFLFLTLLAFLIQKTSVFFIFAYFLYNRKYSVTRIIIVLSLVFFASIYLSSSIFVNIVQTYLTIYAPETLEEEVGRASLITPFCLFQILLLIFFMWVYYKSKSKDKLYEFFMHMLVLAISFQFFASMYVYLNRISLFYFSFIILFLPYASKFIPRGIRSIALLLIIAGFIALYFVGLNSDPQGINPYSFIFFN